ncbi:hypothetical protein [Halomicrococcus sp. NG-SE-24]|uniref:hypothetical protein n=1 Tax=unclassified Halomicrococcus TaxID=2614448 RepID=UPI003D97D5AE
MSLHGEREDPARESQANRSSVGESTPGHPVSWRLGDRLASRDDVSLVGELHGSGARTRTVFDLTNETYLVRTRTPAGREHYREVPKDDCEV